MTGAALAALLEAQGYDFFTGVPCSMISSLIATRDRFRSGFGAATSTRTPR